MTLSIIGRCSKTGQMGIAISSSSIAVGARCPWLRSKVGAVSTQNITLPALGPRILDRLQQGATAETALKAGLDTDDYAAWRQVTVMTTDGQSAFYSGEKTLGVNNALSGENCVAAGNLLANPDVIAAMVQAFEQRSGHLADRLIAAMQAGMSAGEKRARCIRRRCRLWILPSGRLLIYASTGPTPTPSMNSTNSGKPISRRCRTISRARSTPLRRRATACRATSNRKER